MSGFSEVAAIGVGLLLLAQAPTPAPSPSGPPAQLGCHGPGYSEFDFWVGDWDVMVRSGTLAGNNKITRDYDGCVIREEWVGVRGMTGSSFNIYDPVRKRWHQTWVDNMGTLLTMDGEFRDGAMRLEGPGTSPSGPSLNRTTWTPLASGGLRQVWEVSSDDGKTWQLLFDGTYRARQGGIEKP